jgi:hypothetical protein
LQTLGLQRLSLFLAQSPRATLSRRSSQKLINLARYAICAHLPFLGRFFESRHPSWLKAANDRAP